MYVMSTWFARRCMVPSSGRYQALSEIVPQFAGVFPNGPTLEPFSALAEKVEVTVDVQMEPVPPGAAYRMAPKYRAAYNNALLLEECLGAAPEAPSLCLALYPERLKKHYP
jgi:hypothetical protein